MSTRDNMPAPGDSSIGTGRQPESLVKSNSGKPLPAPQHSERGAFKNLPWKPTASNGKTY